MKLTYITLVIVPFMLIAVCISCSKKEELSDKELLLLSHNTYKHQNEGFSLHPPRSWSVHFEDKLGEIFRPDNNTPFGPHCGLEIFKSTSPLVQGKPLNLEQTLNFWEYTLGFTQNVKYRGSLKILSGEKLKYVVLFSEANEKMVKEDGMINDGFIAGTQIVQILGITAKRGYDITIWMRALREHSGELQSLFKATVKSLGFDGKGISKFSKNPTQKNGFSTKSEEINKLWNNADHKIKDTFTVT